MAETTEQQMERLVTAYKNGEDVSAELREMPKDQLRHLKKMLESEKKKTSEEIWATRQKIRAEKVKLSCLEADHARLHKELEGLNKQLWDAFGAIFANPDAALKACWEHEQHNGLSNTEQALKKNPAKFGRLQGMNLLIWKTAGRRQALQWLEVFSYQRLRERYGQAHYAKETLTSAINVAA